MALATQCPHCGTTFRVAHDQLKLRSGLVRCGACKEIFNGIEHLLPADVPPAPTPLPETMPSAVEATGDPADQEINEAASDTAAEPEPEAPQAAVPDDEAVAIDAHDGTDTPADQTAPSADEAPAEPQSATIAPTEPIEPVETTAPAEADEPLYRMTLMDVAEAGLGAAEAAARAARDDAALERAVDDLQGPRLHGDHRWVQEDDVAPAKEFDEPDFIARARRQRRGGRLRRALLVAACLLLLLAALGQTAYTLRSQIAARLPQAAPLLAAACSALGCRIELPMQIEDVTIESSELQALAPDRNTFALSVLLRNRGATVAAWPSIELTLNDTAERPLVRRVFAPSDYLPAAGATAGFGAASEQPVRVYFELAMPKAAGYRVYLFYP